MHQSKQTGDSQPWLDTARFVPLGTARRVFAVGAVRGNLAGLMAIHDWIATRAQPGDRLVYLGDYLGGSQPGNSGMATIEELLAFRRALMARRGWLVRDLAYLRGRSEELTQKLLQIQFAPNPQEIFRFMLQHGIAAVLRTYRYDEADVTAALRGGTLGLGRFTVALRERMRVAGHAPWWLGLRRCAFTQDMVGEPDGLLLVPAGLEPARPVTEQGPALWWDERGFAALAHAPYAAFDRVIRGFGPEFGASAFGLCLDAGPQQVGAALLEPNGGILELIRA